MLSGKLQVRVAVLDMQPITPTIGGGRARLLGAFHALHPRIRCEYVGSFDWPGESARAKQLTPTLHEELIPLSEAHFEALNFFKGGAGSQTIVDALFHLLAPLSGAYLKAAARSIEEADAVVFEHPWVFPCVEHLLHDKFVFYDSQNVEVVLKQKGFAVSALGDDFVRIVAGSEASLISRAHHIFTCSLEDKNALAYIYDAPLSKISVAPNGVFVDSIAPKGSSGSTATANDAVTSVFIGSNYGPNVEAALYITRELAPTHPNIQFVVLGGVGTNEDVRVAASSAANVILVGNVSDEEKSGWLRRSDIAVNPMFSGSGTNIKMFDFMAHGLPIITTPTGARGIASATKAGVFVCEPDEFSPTLANLVRSGLMLADAGRKNRGWAESEFSWGAISKKIGEKILSVVECEGPGVNLPDIPTKSPVIASPEGALSLSVVSTYGVSCGIAGYTEYLVSALRVQNADVEIYLADTPKESPKLKEGSPRTQVAWHWDNVNWVASSVNVPAIVEGARARSKHLNVQYHPGFFPTDVLCNLLSQARRSGLSTSVTLHNASLSSDGDLILIAKQCNKLFVHDKASVKRLSELGFHASLLPMGVPDIGKSDVLPALSGTVPLQIGTFGYMRSHKGFSKIISAIDIVRRVYPDVSLLALCAMTDNPDAINSLKLCESTIRDLGLHGSVELDLSHQDVDSILGKLSRSSFNILAYDQSNEGASGAANMCLGARVPLVVSRSSIFDPLGTAVLRFDDVSVVGIAANILNVLGNRSLREDYARRANQYVDEHGWDNAASLFRRDILSCHEAP